MEIAADILKAATKGLKKGEIKQICNLRNTLLENSLSALLELGLLELEGDKSAFYQTTIKGLELLRLYYYLKWFLGFDTVDFFLLRLLNRLIISKKEMNGGRSQVRYITSRGEMNPI